VLILGAAGGVGHYAVQLARHLGAHVTGTCGPSNVDFVRSLGADEVLDYTRDDALARGGPFDAVFDTAGARAGARRARCSRAAASTSTRARTSRGDDHARRAGRRALRAPARRRAGARGRHRRVAAPRALRLRSRPGPYIRETIGLAGVADAQRRMEGGHGRGKIVVDPSR
jgi:NADPH:quinone reductase-like Zn-dependent oxidoreductase